MPQKKPEQFQWNWVTVLAITGGALMLLRIGVTVPMALTAFPVIVGIILIWDRADKRKKARKLAENVVWKDRLACTLVPLDEEGRSSLFVRVTNTTTETVTLPRLTAWLSFTCHPGGSPGRGGNGLGALGLKEDIAQGRTLASGASALLPLDTAADPVAPYVLMPKFHRPRSELPEWQQKMLKIGEARETQLCATIAAAPSLAAYLRADTDDVFFPELRADGQHPGWMFSGALQS